MQFEESMDVVLIINVKSMEELYNKKIQKKRSSSELCRFHKVQSENIAEMFPKQMERFYADLEKSFKDSGFIAGKSGRHMKYPYTFSAKIAQFPIFHYLKHNWIWTYYPLGWVVGFYFISIIHAAANSEENKKSWAETQRKFAEKEHH